MSAKGEPTARSTKGTNEAKERAKKKLRSLVLVAARRGSSGGRQIEHPSFARRASVGEGKSLNRFEHPEVAPLDPQGNAVQLPQDVKFCCLFEQ
jgi:hypothetical protein